MEDRAENSSDISDVPCRRRGRPMGKNRVPLSINERRARNAQYERERRYETSGALTELAEAAGCDTNLSTSDLLATVISQLQRVAHTQDIEELRRSNEKLIQKVEALEQQIFNWEENQCTKDVVKHAITGKRKRKSKKEEKPAKVMKSSADLLDVGSYTDSRVKLSRDSKDGEEELEIASH